MFLKDFAELNRILKFEEESSNGYLDLYLNMALGFLNATPPPIGAFDMDTFPMPSLLLHQATIEALISNSILQSRNEISYNNGGISVKIPDGNRYNNVLQNLYRAVQLELDAYLKYKVSINVDQAWGAVSSPYAFIAGYPYVIRPSDGQGRG
jgi:hypothetical protein